MTDTDNDDLGTETGGPEYFSDLDDVLDSEGRIKRPISGIEKVESLRDSGHIRVETDNLDEDHPDAVQHIREATWEVEKSMHDLDFRDDLDIDTDASDGDEWLHELGTDPEERDGE